MQPCDRHGLDPWGCPDILFLVSITGNYGIPIRDGGSSYVVITHCPFCGATLNPHTDGHTTDDPAGGDAPGDCPV